MFLRKNLKLKMLCFFFSLHKISQNPHNFVRKQGCLDHIKVLLKSCFLAKKSFDKIFLCPAGIPLLPAKSTVRYPHFHFLSNYFFSPFRSFYFFPIFACWQEWHCKHLGWLWATSKSIPFAGPTCPLWTTLLFPPCICFTGNYTSS